MEFSREGLLALASSIVTQLEGPYRWYIIAGVVLLLTALTTRFIFKTFRWFLLLAVLAAIIIGGFFLFTQWANLG